MFVNARLTQLFVAGMLCGTIAPVGVAQEPAKDFYGDPLPKDSIARLGSVRFHNPKGLTAMAYAQDGKSILAVGSDSMRFWDADMGKELARFDAEKDTGFWMRSAKLSPDGKYIALNQHQAVELLDRHTGKLVRTIKTDNPAHQLLSSAFSPDGKLLVTGNMEWLDDNPIRVWEVETGKELPPFLGRGSSLHALTFSADGKTLTVVNTNGSVVTWDWAMRKVLRKLAMHERQFPRAVLVPHTQSALTAENHGFVFDENISLEMVHLWNISTGKVTHSMPLRKARDQGSFIICEALAASADGRLLATSQIMETQGLRLILRDPVIRLWERVTGKEVLTIKETMGQAIAFSPDGMTLAADDGEQRGWAYQHATTISLWDTLTGARQAKLVGHAAPIHGIAFSPDGKTFATASADHTVLIWKTPPMRAGLNNAKADDKQLEDWWKALAGDDAALAHQAAERLLAHSADATRMIRDKLKPAVPIDAKKIPPLIAALDSPDFEIRHDANQQLEAMGDLAEPALRKALEKPSSLEAKRRLEALIEKALGTTPEYVKAHRALAVLERIGSASARQVVDTIAKGAPGTRLTAEAQTVLERMPAK